MISSRKTYLSAAINYPLLTIDFVHFRFSPCKPRQPSWLGLVDLTTLCLVTSVICKRTSHIFDRSIIFTLSYVGYLPQSIVEPRLRFVKIKQLRFAYLEGIELSIRSQTSGSVLAFRSLGN